MQKSRRVRWILSIIFLLGAAAVVWVIGLSLDRWPWGEYSEIPRIVSLSVLVAGIIFTVGTLWIWFFLYRSRRVLVTALVVTLVFGLLTAWDVRKIVRWRGYIWIGDFLLDRRVPFDNSKPLDVCFCFVDHFEPGGIWNTPETFPIQRRLSRLQAWEVAYRKAIEGHRDSDGQPPQTTWLFPIKDSVPEVIAELAKWPGREWGEIEYHLHHRLDWDGRQVREQIEQDVDALQKIGACTNGYAFVHGVYGLAAGDPKVCQVINELDILKETGCYADFTFPNLYTPAQPSQVNSIFYARTTGLPKPHDRGTSAEVGKSAKGLLLVQGPMWAGFTKAVFDDANLSVSQHPHPSRIDHWIASHVHVRGKPNWIFIVVHTHSATEYAQDMLFQGNMQRTWAALETRFKSNGNRLHYVTAREVYNIIKAAEAGKDGNPDHYRDFFIRPPANRRGDDHTNADARE